MAATIVKILIIDDYALVGRSLGRALRGHEVTVLTSGATALSNIKGGSRYEAIVCDVLMPELDGVALHQALLVLAPDQAARMIFMCGVPDAIDDASYVRTLPNPVIEKPFDVAALRQLIATMR